MTPTERSKAWAKANPERVKAIKAKHLARLKAWRLANPEKAREVQARWREKNKESHRAAIKRWREKNREHAKAVESERARRRFFHTRAKNSVWRTKNGDVAEIRTAIFWLWHKQRGRCALTGKRLDRTAELDHIIPVSKGGLNHPSNLQWLSPEVNQCKNDLTEQEFIAICKAVLSYKQ
jgi:5-methylcytosine-specific restriction endonuclease McrA